VAISETIVEEAKIPRGVRKLFQASVRYGVLHLGYSLVDYLRHAIDNYGWECIPIGGVKGEAKSNLLLQTGYAIFEDWDAVHEYTVMEPEDFLNILDQRGRHPWVGWDDITAHLPRSLYFTDRELWAELQKNWALYRTKMNCFVCTAPRKNRIATFILEDITGDIICFNRVGLDIKSHFDFQRWMWQRDLKDPKSMVARPIQVESIPFPLTPDAWKIDKEMQAQKIRIDGVTYSGADFYEKVSLMGVPRREFKKYWKRRIELADKASADFRELLGMRTKKENPKVKAANARWDKIPTVS